MNGAKLGLSGVVALASVHLAALGHHAPTPYHTDRIGVTVKVAGLPSRDDTPQMFGKNLLLPDGREVLLDEFGAYWTTNTIGGFSPPDPVIDPAIYTAPRVREKAWIGGGVVPEQSLLLRAAMSEARTVTDPAGNSKLSKATQGGRRARSRDDAAAAAVLAVAHGWRLSRGQKRGRVPRVYVAG